MAKHCTYTCPWQNDLTADNVFQNATQTFNSLRNEIQQANLHANY